MDIRTRMVVIGYNSNRADEIPAETFIFSWQELQGGTIEFFNSDDNPSEMLKNLLRRIDSFGMMGNWQMHWLISQKNIMYKKQFLMMM